MPPRPPGTGCDRLFVEAPQADSAAAAGLDLGVDLKRPAANLAVFDVALAFPSALVHEERQRFAAARTARLSLHG